MATSQELLDKRMYHAAQCIRMTDELLHELVEGPDEAWREGARAELERRASPVKLSIYGRRLSAIE